VHAITLVCSAHRENGRCNVEELLRILQALAPVVIFEEFRPGEFDFHYQHGSVEAHAVKRYCDITPCRQVPVDRYGLAGDEVPRLKGYLDQANAYVARTNQEYQLLEEKNGESTYLHGFQYLNSARCGTILSRMIQIEDETVSRVGNEEWLRAFETWNRLLQSRDQAMVAGIYECCRANPAAPGVFLVGAGHKAGIVNEIEKYAGTDPRLIEWNLDFDGGL